MGWSYGWSSRKRLIDELTKTWTSANGTETRCIAKYGYGFTSLWAVFERRTRPVDDEAAEVTRFICLLMLRCAGKDWGYKDVTADMGPTEVSCPLSYLSMATSDTLQGYGKEWAERVRKWHASRGAGLKLQVGMTVPLRRNSQSIQDVLLVSVHPKIVGETGWGRVHIKRGLIDFDKMAATAA